jgi:hypothetical protein
MPKYGSASQAKPTRYELQRTKDRSDVGSNCSDTPYNIIEPARGTHFGSRRRCGALSGIVAINGGELFRSFHGLLLFAVHSNGIFDAGGIGFHSFRQPTLPGILSERH